MKKEITIKAEVGVCPLCKGTGELVKMPDKVDMKKIIDNLRQKKFTARQIADVLGFKHHSLVYWYKDGGWKTKKEKTKRS